MLVPRGYQLKEALWHYENLKKYMISYLAWEERTGKSLTACLVCEMAKVQHILVITKAKAKANWEELVADKCLTKDYQVVTYGAPHKFLGRPDIVILDEAHNYISGYPKPSATWLSIKSITHGVPIIYLSATPHAQGYQMLYHQFALSSWSPWVKYSTFYNWFKTYGIQRQIKIHDRWVNQYDTVNEDFVTDTCSHLFSYKTRKELGFQHEPVDKIHWIELSEETKTIYNSIIKDKVLAYNKRMILCDTPIKLRTTLHQLEGGTIKQTLMGVDCDKVVHCLGGKAVKLVSEKIKDAKICHAYFVLDNNEKVDYILKTWGDTDQLCIMYNYIGEEYKLRSTFKHAVILQATSYAEGVDLAHIEDIVVYSQDFSTARHTQRRARQASKDRSTPIKVNFLLVKKAISYQVYDTVSVNKKNYVDSSFKRELL